MLPIMRLEAAGDGVILILHLEGRVIGPWIDELGRACKRVMATGVALTLDLADVAFVERRGAALLKDLIDGGAAVVNCPAFVGEQLKALSAC